jgi:hypothetical protein
VIRFASHAALGVLLAAALATGGAVAPAHAQPATTGTPNAGTSSSAPVTTPSRSHRRRNTSSSTANGGPANTGAASTGSASTGANSTGANSTGANSTGVPGARTSSARAVPSGRGQFSTEAAARRSCPSDTVVWANSSSKTLHLSGDRYFGKTKRGAFMCQREAMQAGYHVAGKGAVGGKKTTTSSSH